MTKAAASLRIPFRSERQMRAVADALRPEAAQAAGVKAHATIVARGKQLILRFEGNDSTTLRAIMSSYLRLIRASMNTCSAVLQVERASSRIDRN
jgi:tRNA threonylcarbamoyladenosine modification (KEOPS) complex  Pcc1 subunit